jgi:cytochrome b6
VFAPLKEIIRTERQRTVPSHVNFLHYLGAVAFLFFFLEVATGILLMIYYRPSAAAAYHSTAIITDEVSLGWLIRSLHRWGSDFLILLCFLHLVRVYFSRAYQAPRQLNWLVGICLLVLILTLGFTGTLLPWDQYAYWYIDSARQTISGVPVLGSIILGLIWGGWDIGEEVLLRFYAFHVAVLPWLALALLSFHVLMIWRFGVKEPAQVSGSPQAPPITFVPDFILNLFIALLLLGGLLFSLAVVFPPALSHSADPLSPLSHAQPRWYLLAVRELLRHLHGGTAALGIITFLLLLFLVPVFDPNPVQPTWKKVLQRALGLLVIAAWILLGVRGYLR